MLCTPDDEAITLKYVVWVTGQNIQIVCRDFLLYRVENKMF